jgi:DNA polymerase III epsilon subunit-like protein
MIAFVFDLETTGLPLRRKATTYKDLDVYDSARIVSIAWRMVNTETGEELANNYFIIKPSAFEIPEDSTKIHGITTERAQADGFLLTHVIDMVGIDIAQCNTLVAHNIHFDVNVLRSELYRMKRYNIINKTYAKDLFCTMMQSRKQGVVNKISTLAKTYAALFQDEMELENCHDAYYDVMYCLKIFKRLLELKNT